MANKTYTSEELKNIFLEQIDECIESINGTFSRKRVELDKATALFILDECIYLEVLTDDEIFNLVDKVEENACHRLRLLK